MPSIAGPDLPLREWLSAAAAKRATPGGGSAAALAGALAAAMGEMTLNYSTGRKGNTPEAEQILRHNLAELTRARALLLALMQEDQDAYAALTSARKLDDSDPDKARRMADSLAAAIRVPQAIMAAGMSILAAAERVAPHANKWLLSDLAVCCELALAAVRCGGHNVLVNLADLPEEQREAVDDEVEAILARAAALHHETTTMIAP
jgi:glutamate formiminotransferase/formiminotetrahydrofolate cyclodeaminase